MRESWQELTFYVPCGHAIKTCGWVGGGKRRAFKLKGKERRTLDLAPGRTAAIAGCSSANLQFFERDNTRRTLITSRSVGVELSSAFFAEPVVEEDSRSVV